jgi:hypothetical protein
VADLVQFEPGGAAVTSFSQVNKSPGWKPGDFFLRHLSNQSPSNKKPAFVASHVIPFRPAISA